MLTVLSFKKLQVSCSSRSAVSYPTDGEAEGYYTRLLWTIPEDEDVCHGEDRRVQLSIWKGGAVKSSSGKRGRGARVGDDYKCNFRTKRMQLKSHLMTSTTKVHEWNKVKVVDGWDPSSKSQESRKAPPVGLAARRHKSNEEQLREECEEMYELYRAIAEGRLSLEEILNLKLRSQLRLKISHFQRTVVIKLFHILNDDMGVHQKPGLLKGSENPGYPS
ncbi:hypothetical protein R1sor_012466 [Riccia sorocarpa]|uniref:Uncharacterized protein n=1 Tax=Riccia sorocarpa TaxID=122646 RepID=A0ABD3I7M5_9MARC